MDINNLKIINDNFGHVSGDKVIKTCFDILCEILDKDEIYRIGGDEFACFIKYKCSDVELNQYYSKLKTAIETANESFDFNFAIGHSIWQIGDTVEGALARADTMMYKQKGE